MISVLGWTHEHFGERARLRYEALLGQAIIDIGDDPERLGVTRRDELADGAFTYHLWHSRLNVERDIGRVKRPRHFLLFRVTNNVIEVGRILHDSMELTRHLPPAYRKGDDAG